MSGDKISVLITGPKTSGAITGGVQTHIQNFLSAFDKSERVCVRFFPLTLGLYKKESWPAKFARNVSLVIPYINEGSKVEVIHLNSTFDMRSVIRDAFYVSLGIWILRKKVILQFHGGRPSALSIFRWPGCKQALGIIYRKTGSILILSKRQGQEFKKCFPAVKHIIVPNFINTNIGVTSRDAKRHKEVTFLFMSRLNETKGVREILIAVESLMRSGVSFKVIFCGDGPLKEWLQDQIKIRELEEYVKYLGVVAGKEKEQVFFSADVLLLPTRHKEGFPYTILEAFKYSLPVISSAEGAIGEIVESGINGFLVESTDAKALEKRMREFCEEPDKMSRMGREARKTLEDKYSLGNMTQTFERIYES